MQTGCEQEAKALDALTHEQDRMLCLLMSYERYGTGTAWPACFRSGPEQEASP